MSARGAICRLSFPLAWAAVAGCAEPLTFGDCPLPSQEYASQASQAWFGWAEEQAAAFEDSRTCPTELPASVPTSDGCDYPPEAAMIDGYTAIELESYESYGNSFAVEFSDVWPVGGCVAEEGIATGLAVSVDQTSLPVAATSGFWVIAGALHQGGVVSQDGVSSEFEHGLLGWLCIDGYTGSTTPEPGPEPASGSLYLHVEHWDDPERAPADLFLVIDHNDCAPAEDASGEPEPTGGSYYPPYWRWPYDCDGVDNDLDGVVDEYAVDADADGVPDCQQCLADDWPCGEGDTGMRARAGR